MYKLLLLLLLLLSVRHFQELKIQVQWRIQDVQFTEIKMEDAKTMNRYAIRPD